MGKLEKKIEVEILEGEIFFYIFWDKFFNFQNVIYMLPPANGAIFKSDNILCGPFMRKCSKTSVSSFYSSKQLCFIIFLAVKKKLFLHRYKFADMTAVCYTWL